MNDIGNAGTKDSQLGRLLLPTIRDLIIGASLGGFAATALSAQSRLVGPTTRPVESWPVPFPGGGSASPDSGNTGSGGGNFSPILFIIVIGILWLCGKILARTFERLFDEGTVRWPMVIVLMSIFVLVGSVAAHDGDNVLAALLVSLIPVSLFICLPYLGIVALRERAARRRERRTAA